MVLVGFLVPTKCVKNLFLISSYDLIEEAGDLLKRTRAAPFNVARRKQHKISRVGLGIR